jgi:hypothetical protein
MSQSHATISEHPTNHVSLKWVAFALMVAIGLFYVLSALLYQAIFAQSALAQNSLPRIDDFDTTRPYTVFAGNWQHDANLLRQMSLENDQIILFPDMRTSQVLAPHFIQTEYMVEEGEPSVGLLFYVANSSELANGHMVRLLPSDSGVVVLYGFYNQDGDFQGQGTSDVVPISLDAGEPTVLTVSLSRYQYDVWVNDARMVQDAPLLYKDGHVGLLTAFSSVAFDSLAIRAGNPSTTNLQPTRRTETIVDADASLPLAVGDAPDSVDANETVNLMSVDANTNWQSLAGDWTITPDVISQTSTNAEDMSLYAEQRFSAPMVISTTLTHDATMGAGLLFASPATNTLEGASMVRFLDDSTLIYGYFTGEGFVAQGTVPISAQPQNTYELSVSLMDGQYQIRLNGETVTEAVSLQGVDEGYVGLLTNNASVRFTSLTLQIPVQAE